MVCIPYKEPHTAIFAIQTNGFGAIRNNDCNTRHLCSSEGLLIPFSAIAETEFAPRICSQLTSWLIPHSCIGSHRPIVCHCNFVEYIVAQRVHHQLNVE